MNKEIRRTATVKNGRKFFNYKVCYPAFTILSSTVVVTTLTKLTTVGKLLIYLVWSLVRVFFLLFSQQESINLLTKYRLSQVMPLFCHSGNEVKTLLGFLSTR